MAKNKKIKTRQQKLKALKRRLIEENPALAVKKTVASNNTTLTTQKQTPSKAEKDTTPNNTNADGVFEGIRENIKQTLHESGFSSLEDFAKVTEDALLQLKGIGKTTVSTLKENGVTFKN